MVLGPGQHLRVPIGRVHSISQQGEGVHVLMSGIIGRNLRCGDPIGQLLPRSESLDSTVVTTQLGTHFQAVVREYHSMACCSGMTTEEVHIMAIHHHYEIPKGSLIG